MIEPTGYTALDLVGFTDRGTYAANVNYVKNDLVHYGGNIWRILIDDTIGITPAEGPNYTLFIGEPTNLVERIIAPLEDNPATVAYQTGRQIIYNDYLYEVIDDIAVGDVLIAYEDDPTNANIKLASPVETQVLALDGRLDTAEDDIDALEKVSTNNIGGYAGDDIKKKHFLLMGDSYLRGTICIQLPDTYTRNYEDGWGYKASQFLGLDSQHVEGIGVGGASFALSGGEHWQDTVSTYQSTQDPNLIDTIVLLGGANDRGSSRDNILSGISQFFINAKAKYPNAKIIMGFIGFCRQYNDIGGLRIALKAYHDGCIANGGIFIGGLENIAQDAYLMGIDNLHPTANGYTEIGRAVANVLRGSNCDYVNKKILTATSLIGGSISSLVGTNYIHNNLKVLSIPAVTITGLSIASMTASPSTYMDILTLDNTDVIGGSGLGPACTCIGFINHAGGTYAGFFSAMVINKKLSIMLIDRSASDWLTLSNVTAIALRGIQIVDDSLNSY